MPRTVLGIHDPAGPVLIRTNGGTGTPSSQDMAVLGSIMTYAEGLGLPFASVSTHGHRVGFHRVSSNLFMTLISPSRTHSDQDIRQFLQVSYFAVQMLVGPSELDIMAKDNTANGDLRRALLGICGVLDALLRAHCTPSRFTSTPEVTAVAPKHSAAIAAALHHLSQEAGTEYAAIAFDNVYAIATPSFWHLHHQELLVLQMILQSLPGSCTLAQIPLHLPHTAGDRSWYVLMVSLTAGCRLITLTSGDCTLAHAQALVVQKFGMLKQSLQKAKSLAMSSSVLSDDSLLAFVVQQYHPDCVMVSSCQPSTHQQVDPGVASQGSPTATNRPLHADDLARHQEALGIVCTFAALLHKDMAIHTHGQANGRDSEVAEACAELAGMRLVAIMQQQGKTRRMLYAALSQHLELASSDAQIAHVASVLKRLPVLGTGK